MTFNDSKYTRWYLTFISKILLEERNKDDERIYERHHILPKSIFPEFENLKNFPWNGVLLTPREHFICHLLLTRMFDDITQMMKMQWALHRMAFSSVYKSRLYHNSRITWSEKLSKFHHAHRINGWNEKMSDLVLDQWKDDCERRKLTSDRMKDLWETRRDELTEKNKENGKKAIIEYREKNKHKIEYKGNHYYSWENLLKETGCSKHLYRKYYLKGIDPVSRIGADGPPRGSKQSVDLVKKRSEGMKNFHKKRKESQPCV